MTYRLSIAQLRADFAALGPLTAVARKYGTEHRTIQARVPDLRGPGLKNKSARAALLHEIGLTLDEVMSATGLTAVEVVQAIRARHVRLPVEAVRAIAAHAGR